MENVFQLTLKIMALPEDHINEATLTLSVLSQKAVCSTW